MNPKTGIVATLGFPIARGRMLSGCRRFSSPAAASQQQNSLPAAYYRGGTSRGIFFQQKDLPTERSEWPPIFLGTLGSPDPYGRQLDGMGGGISSLSKVCVIGPSGRKDADVDYTFIAVGVKDSDVDYSSNCGNLTSAVGPFAVDSKMFEIGPGSHDVITVRIHNTNTGKIIHSSFPAADGEAMSSGNFRIDGVAGEAARIKLDFIRPAGSRTGKLLPTGTRVDKFDGIRVTCIDVGNPCCFVHASELDVDGSLTPDMIESHPNLLQRLDSIRRQGGVRMGLAESPSEVPGSVPKICLVSPPPTSDHLDGSESRHDGSKIDVMVRAVSVGQAHKAVPITVALSIAASAKLSGSIVAECVRKHPQDPTGITIGHASGKLMVGASFDSEGALDTATVYRTARRLMEGRVFWK